MSGGCANDNGKGNSAVAGTNSTAASSSLSTELSLSPNSQTVTVSSRVPFTASGGVPPYTYRVLSGGGDITTAGVYTAPSSSSSVQVGVFDSYGTWAYATLTVSSAAPTSQDLTLSPASQTVNPSASFQVTASGGTLPYTYYAISGGAVLTNATNGTFTAPSSASSVQVAVQDGTGLRAYAWITVSGASTPLLLTPASPSIVGGTTTRFTASGGTGTYNSYFVYSGGGTISPTGEYTSVSSLSTYTVRVGVQDSGGNTTYASVTVTPNVTCSGNYTIYQYSSSTSWTGTMNITQYASGYFTGTMYFAGQGLGYGSTAISGNCYTNGTIAFTRVGPFGASGGRTYPTQTFTGNFYSTTGSQVAMYGSFTALDQTLNWYAVPR